MAGNEQKNKAETPIDEDDDVVVIDLWRFAISAFVVWQIMATILWLTPESQLQSSIVAPLRCYMWLVGCDQNWNMFAPNPAGTDVYLTANVTYQDGSQKTWNFPRMHELGYIRRYQEERFRKMIEFAHQDSYSRMWPSLARFVAIANNDHPKTNPVVHVDLVRHFVQIPNPGVPLPPYTTYTFYRADFGPGSLPQ